MEDKARVNLPEVVATVRAAFERYEQALVERDVAVLDELFWDSPWTVRYGLSETGYGFDEIHAHRIARRSMPARKGERVRLVILTLGESLATVHLEFKTDDPGRIGRQSQTWVWFPADGWRVIAAHVSLIRERRSPAATVSSRVNREARGRS